MNSSEADQLNKEILKAAASIAQDWPGVTTADDLGQDLWVRVSELTAERQRSLLNLPPGARMSQLRKWCRQAASKTRDEYEVLSGNYRYAVSEVRQMLEDRWLEESALHEDGALDDKVLDFRLAVHRLLKRNEDYYNALIGRYITGDYSDTGAYKRKQQRAVDALTQEMNRSWIKRNDEFHGVQLRKDEFTDGFV